MGCAKSKQADPAKPEPGSVAFAETDEVEEQRIVTYPAKPEPGSVAFAEADEVDVRGVGLLSDEYRCRTARIGTRWGVSFRRVFFRP